MAEIPSEREMEIALAEKIGEHRKQIFSESTVAICGLGGLGSNIAVSLLRAGIGKLILIDFDKVDISNLNRQQYKASQIGQYKVDALAENLKEFFPYAKLEKCNVYINENNYAECFSSADIIFEAFDKAEEKSKLVNYVLEYMPSKTIVAASGMAGLDSPNKIRTKQITKHFYLCGDGVSSVDTGDCLYAPRVMLCAAHQALTVLRILLKNEV